MVKSVTSFNLCFFTYFVLYNCILASSLYLNQQPYMLFITLGLKLRQNFCQCFQERWLPILICLTSSSQSSSLSAQQGDNTGLKMKEAHWGKALTCGKFNLGKIVEAGSIKKYLSGQASASLMVFHSTFPSLVLYSPFFILCLFVCISFQIYEVGVFLSGSCYILII